MYFKITRQNIANITDNYNGEEYPELIAAFRSFGVVHEFLGNVDTDKERKYDDILRVINAANYANSKIDDGCAGVEREAFELAKQQAREVVQLFLEDLIGRPMNSDEQFFVNLKLGL